MITTHRYEHTKKQLHTALFHFIDTFHKYVTFMLPTFECFIYAAHK